MHNVDYYIEQLHQGFVLSPRAVYEICENVKSLLCQESNVLRVNAPVTVVGDIHGVETISLLFCLKLKYPKNVFLIRGNHENRPTTTIYGFYMECQAKYEGSSHEWNSFVDVFNFLPLAAVIDGEIFCVHGGLSPSIQRIEQIQIINRFQEIPSEGAMCDLVWSDPDKAIPDFQISPRGAGYVFGAEIVFRFLHMNQMQCILRAHQLCQSGYESFFDDALHTVWSAPNYCGRCGNLASVYILDQNLQGEFVKFGPSQLTFQDNQQSSQYAN
ncbi:putative serine/threonine protein phosphatase, partial [Dispira simplex]